MAVSSRQAPTIEHAQAITDHLVRSYPSIEAVLLCGSVARGDADRWSDIDLVVIGSDVELTAESLRSLVADREEHVSVIYYTTPEFRKLLREGTLFMAHLKAESIALFDSAGITSALARLSLTSRMLRQQIRLQTAKLSVYRDPRRFNNNFLFCLAHLYSIGKGVVMLGLARKGVLEFNREAAFERFAAFNPDLSPEVQKVAQLRPFYRLVTGRQPEPQPYSYRTADGEMQQVVRAIETLARRAERL